MTDRCCRPKTQSMILNADGSLTPCIWHADDCPALPAALQRFAEHGGAPDDDE